MKKTLVSLLGCSLLVFLFAPTAQTQEIKKLPEVFITASTNSAPISSRLSKAFRANFKNAEQPVWDQQGKFFYVYFLTDDMTNRAMYTKRGMMIYQLSYGLEHNLPLDVRHLLRSTFYDYNIGGVINVKKDRQNIWLANLQDNKNLLLVRVDDEGMAVLSKYDRSN